MSLEVFYFFLSFSFLFNTERDFNTNTTECYAVNVQYPIISKNIVTLFTIYFHFNSFYLSFLISLSKFSGTKNLP